MNKSIKVQHRGSLGIIWIIGWLFTIGFLNHGFWKGLLALIVWPWFLGVHFSDNPPKRPEHVQIEESASAARLAWYSSIGDAMIISP